MQRSSPLLGKRLLAAVAVVGVAVAVAAGIYVSRTDDGNGARPTTRAAFVPNPADDPFTVAILNMTHQMWVADAGGFGAVSEGEQEQAGRCVVAAAAGLSADQRARIAGLSQGTAIAQELDRVVPAAGKDAVQQCIEGPIVAARTRAAVATTRPALVADAGCEAAKAGAQALAPFSRGQLAAFRPSETPVRLSDLTFTSPQGEATTLADFAGQTTLINLWATWCVPCRAEMPALDRLAKAEGDDGFKVLPINLDTGDAAKPGQFLAEIGAEALPLYTDPELKSLNALKRRGMILGGLPTTLLIDGEGCVLGLIEGPAEWDSADGVALVNAARGRTPAIGAAAAAP